MNKPIAFAAALALSSSISFATPLFVPDPSTASGSSTPPTSFTAGTAYTQVNGGSGTISYSPTSFTVGDTAANGNQAYIASAEQVANTDVVNTTLTFTPSYSNTDPTGGSSGQSNSTILTLEPTSNANNDVLSVTIQTLGFGVDDSSILLDSGIAFGGGTKTGNQEYSVHGVNALSGTTFTLNITQVFSTSHTGNSTIVTTGTLSDAANPDLFDYNYTVTTNTNGFGYDPANDFGGGGLTLDAGLVAVSNDTGFVNPGGTVELSNISVNAVPEPASFALVGVAAIGLLSRRRRSATRNCI